MHFLFLEGVSSSSIVFLWFDPKLVQQLPAHHSSFGPYVLGRSKFSFGVAPAVKWLDWNCCPGIMLGKFLCFTVPKNYAVRDSDMRPLSANSEFWSEEPRGRGWDCPLVCLTGWLYLSGHCRNILTFIDKRPYFIFWRSILFYFQVMN